MASTAAAPDVLVPAAGPVPRRSLWWVVHSWTGLKLSLFMSFVLLTGTLAVFSNEMDWLTRPALRVTPPGDPARLLGTMAESARAAVPGGRLATIHAPPHTWFAAEALIETGNDRRVRVYLDPWTGAARGTGGWLSVQRFFRELHRHLLLPAKWGIPIVSSLSLLLILSLVTGLVSYKKFWRGFLRRPHTGNARRLTGDLHRLGGLWSLWFVALIALTGLWYLVESLGGDAPYAKPPAAVERAAPLGGATVDRLAQIARTAYPALTIREIRFPEEPGDAIGFMGQADAVLVRDRVNAVWIDPLTGRVLDIWRGETLTVHQRISEMADPLHFGTWGGMATKIVWFVFGMLMTGLSVTGAMIYSLRLKTAYAGQGGIARAARGMGAWLYPAAALVMLSLALIPGWLMSG